MKGLHNLPNQIHEERNSTAYALLVGGIRMPTVRTAGKITNNNYEIVW